jgi:hypothetical protein
VVKKKVEVAEIVEEEDDFSSLAPRAAATSALPPKVVKKKKVEKVTGEKRRASSANPSDPAEVLVPVCLIVAGLGLNVAAALVVNDWHLTTGYAIGFRFLLVAASTVFTLAALFVAAAVLDLSYGFLHTAILKVIAITVTQAWVGDMAEMIPIPFAGWLIAFGTTYAMFKYFFELDDMEVIASMFVVRMVHWLLSVFVIVAIIAAVVGGAVPDGAIDPGMFQGEDAGEGNVDMQDDADLDEGEDPAGMNL